MIEDLINQLPAVQYNLFINKLYTCVITIVFMTFHFILKPFSQFILKKVDNMKLF